MWKLPKGKDFLPGVSLKRLQKLYREEEEAKPKLRLLCAIHRKEGRSIDEISEITYMKRRTVHATLRRFAERGITARYSIKQDGRPPKLTKKQRREIIKKLERGPPHNRSGLWTTKEVKAFILKNYGVKYTLGHVWELLKVAGFSIQRPRPRHYKSPPKEEIEVFKKRLQSWRRDTGRKDS